MAWSTAPSPAWRHWLCRGDCDVPRVPPWGSGVADFFNPPFVVVGTADQRVTDLLTEMFSFLNREITVVDVRSAEALKYACNAFHATKVSFANDMGRIFRAFGVDSREVMRVFSEDKVLNISPAYLMPGFAFGSSPPKDLRALLDMARVNALDVPQLAGTGLSNERVIADVVDRLVASPFRRIAMLGLSFKMNTDDLRESPNVELTERLIGKGFEVQIYDPIVNPECLIGSNLQYIESRLPHLRRLLSATPREALQKCDAQWSPRQTASLSTSYVQHRLPGYSTCTGASALTSNDCPPMREWGGRCDRAARGKCTATNSDHRSELAGALRPSGVVGVQGTHRGRLRHRRLSPRKGDPRYEVLEV